ncbi:MAG: tRNA adenosine deaminase-associated protein [Mycobacteriales bacterium]
MSDEGYAVVAYIDADGWQCEALPEATTDDLAGCLAVLRQQPDGQVTIVLVEVDGEFFIALRSEGGGEVAALLSDRTAAADYDIARQTLEFLDEEPSEDDSDEVWPAGELGIFTDLGLDERELQAILDDLDLYADEMVEAIAGRVGFGEAYAAAADPD